MYENSAKMEYRYPKWAKKLPDFISVFFKKEDTLTFDNAYREDTPYILNFKHITTLNIQNAKITNPEILCNLKNLKVIHAEGSNIPRKTIEKMKKIIPHCQINY